MIYFSFLYDFVVDGTNHYYWIFPSVRHLTSVCFFCKKNQTYLCSVLSFQKALITALFSSEWNYCFFQLIHGCECSQGLILNDSWLTL